MIQGTRNQLIYDGKIKSGCFGVQAIYDEDLAMNSVFNVNDGYSGEYVDDMTKQVLKDELVLTARQVELEYFNSKGVWLKVPRNQAREKTGRPPITVRWVDVNKGDESNPNYRSRLVARQLEAMGNSGDSFFAPSPLPLRGFGASA